MTRLMITGLVLALLAGCGSDLSDSGAQAPAADPLPSWNAGETRDAITAFVGRVTDPASPDFVPEPERIAVFDNDGTLWCEQPFYVQLDFALDRVKAMAPDHPEWADSPVLSAAAAGDVGGVLAEGEHGILEVIMASHAGMTTDEFATIADEWIRGARHDKLDRPYLKTVYQPMLELLAYLRGAGFKTYIVSGGGVEFMRPWTEEIYGIPPEQVVGSSIKTVFEMTDAGPVIRRLPEIDFIDDKAGKPVGIHKFIGRRPIFVGGNSDGDLQMLQWGGAGGARFGLIVRHTDAEREYAYDRESHVGRLDKALDLAPDNGWTVVDMKNDWKTVFPALD
jgi:hypothetical protein